MLQHDYIFECWDYWTDNVQFIEALNEEHAIQIYKETYGGEIIQSIKIA